MRAVLMAGDPGSHLWPTTRAVAKLLLPVFDKPMVYYPLSTLISSGITDVLVLAAPGDLPQLRRLLGDGGQWGLRLTYSSHSPPDGIGQAFLAARDFLDGGPCVLMLGDHLCHGHVPLGEAWSGEGGRSGAAGAVVFAHPGSRSAVPGLCCYDERVPDIAAGLALAAGRAPGITALNQAYLRRGRLRVELLARGVVWLDTATPAQLMAATEYVRVIEQRQGIKIGCVEEAAWRTGLIGDADLRTLAEPLCRSGYGDYLLALLDEPGPRLHAATTAQVAM